LANSASLGLISDTKHSDNTAVLRLRNELGDDPYVVKRTLGIGQTHRAVEDIDRTKTTGVIPSVLASG